MSNKENTLKTLKRIMTDKIPVSPHWWGLYKFELAGMIKDYKNESKAWSLCGEELAQIDIDCYERFRPDTFHLTTGSSRTIDSPKVAQEKKRLCKAMFHLESYAIIDEYIDAFHQDKETVLKSGVFDHVKIISHRFKDSSLILLNEGNPISWLLDPHSCLGFENGLILMLEEPEKMEYFVYESYKSLIPRMEALKASGADGYIGSETYCGGDMISPNLYRKIIFGAQQFFYRTISELGLIPISYFTGDVISILEDIKKLGIEGLMVEESKKNIKIEISQIYDRLEQTICLFGNLDTIEILKNGAVQDVVDETERQLKSCAKGGFIMSNGCPVSFATPIDNINAMIETTRKHKKRAV